MVITFGIILLFSSIREGVEDYQRYKKDKKANEKRYVYYNDKKIGSKEFEYKHSKKIHVGEIMKIFHDEEVPADICILKSSNMNGISFVDTVNLDGESNLKDKKCNQKTQGMSDLSLCNLTAILKCDKPNEQLEYWEGYLNIFSSIEPVMISLE
jgi:P-type E1-E2 ATPase